MRAVFELAVLNADKGALDAAAVEGRLGRFPRDGGREVAAQRPLHP